MIVSELNSCVADALADGLTPGATLVADVGGTTFAKAQINRPLQWIGLDQTKTIAASAVMKVHQEASIGGQTVQSPMWKSLPIPKLELETLPPPDIAPPLEGCRTLVTVAAATPGAILRIDNGGMSEGTVNPWASFAAEGFPLTPGPLVAPNACRVASSAARMRHSRSNHRRHLPRR